MTQTQEIVSRQLPRQPCDAPAPAERLLDVRREGQGCILVFFVFCHRDITLDISKESEMKTSITFRCSHTAYELTVQQQRRKKHGHYEHRFHRRQQGRTEHPDRGGEGRSGSSSAMRTRWRSPGSSEGYERIGSSLPTIGCHRPEDLPGFHGAVSFHRSTMPAR